MSEKLKYAFPDELNTGMTLRDYFAAKMLPVFGPIYDSWAEAATASYKAADAMLKARNS